MAADQSKTSKTDAKVPVDHASPAQADRPPGSGAKDRPGFDLGGSVDPSNTAQQKMKNPRGSGIVGPDATDGSDGRPVAGGVRPPGSDPTP